LFVQAQVYEQGLESPLELCTQGKLKSQVAFGGVVFAHGPLTYMGRVPRALSAA